MDVRGHFGRGRRVVHVYSCADCGTVKTDTNAIESTVAVVEL